MQERKIEQKRPNAVSGRPNAKDPKVKTVLLKETTAATKIRESTTPPTATTTIKLQLKKKKETTGSAQKKKPKPKASANPATARPKQIFS